MSALKQLAERFRKEHPTIAPAPVSAPAPVTEGIASHMWDEMQAENAPDIEGDARDILSAAQDLEKAAPGIEYENVMDALSRIIDGVWSIAYDLNLDRIEGPLKAVRKLMGQELDRMKRSNQEEDPEF